MNHAVRARSFTPIDTAWLLMDIPTSTTLIAGLLLFDEPVDFECLREQIAGRLLRFDRFLQRPRPPVLPLTLPVWEPDPHFDLDAHLHSKQSTLLLRSARCRDCQHCASFTH